MTVSLEAQLYPIKLKSLSSLPDAEGSGCPHLFYSPEEQLCRDKRSGHPHAASEPRCG